MRFIVEEAVTGVILSRDLEVTEPKVVCNLSGPATVEFTVPAGISEDIQFRAFGQYIHVEITVSGVRRIIASAIIRSGEVDQTGNLKVTAEGFSSYAKGIPWIDDYNPIVVDPFEVIHRIWDSLQSYQNGDIGVTVTPASSGTFLLPGFSFDGTNLNIEFFAFFVRANDFRDSGDEMNALARDIPFDYTERSAWNEGRTAITKELRLAYPKEGVQQNALSFRLGENVLEASPKQESEIQWTSDVIIRGWFPGSTYSSTLSNADPTRFRRVIMEDDAMINSNERSAVWAERKLTRRQVPNYWEKITIDMYHPNAPLGSWDLGDSIYVQGLMPRIGKVEAWHRIMSYAIDEASGRAELGLKHEGAFNYDPIEFVEQP